MSAAVEKVLVGGGWRESRSEGTFQAIDPNSGDMLPHVYPVSGAADVDAALAAGAAAARELDGADPAPLARFLELYADRIDARKQVIAGAASLETALPVTPRLADVELPRTSNQLRQAAAAVRSRAWTLPTIDTASNIRSMFAPLGGPVAVFGPNNFPLAFNGIAGGDFAAAIAAGNPVIAKAHPSHPRTSQLLAQAAHEAVLEAGLPPATVQMIYRTSHVEGARLVSDARIGATGYTGSRSAGLALKAAADGAGKPIYLELSSVNPVFVLPGLLRERLDGFAEEFAGSALLGAGQFCTNPGVAVMIAGDDAERFIEAARARFEAAPIGALLGEGGVRGMEHAVTELRRAGATLVTGGEPAGPGCRFRNTLLRIDGDAFLADPEGAQTEAFGNGNVVVLARDAEQMVAVAESLEGNLTGCIYSSAAGADDALYARIEPALRRRVGRLLNDKMPTGVAVVPSMNHGGPYPATGHPGFTAVGIPASLRRFAMLRCYDNVRAHRLPPELQDANPTRTWRLVDNTWTQAAIG